MENSVSWRNSLRSASSQNRRDGHGGTVNTFVRASSGRRMNIANSTKESNNYPKDIHLTKSKINKPLNLHEDCFDEILSLKKKIALLTAQNKELNVQCRLFKENLSKKEGELVKLNNPAEDLNVKQSAHGSKQSLLRNIRSLHQKLFKLETQLQEKDSEYSRLVTDMKFTRTEELRIQLETAYTEIRRLKEKIHIMSSEQCQVKEKPFTKPRRRSSTSENNEVNTQIRTLGKVIKELDQQKQELIAKNHCLVSKIQKLYKCLSSSDLKEDINPYRAPEDDEHSSQIRKCTKSSDGHLVATIIESTVSEKVKNETPKVSVIVRQDEKTVEELATAKTQIVNLQQLNKTLSDANEKLKSQYEVIQKKMKEQEAELQKHQKRPVKEDGCQTEINNNQQSKHNQDPRNYAVTFQNETSENIIVKENRENLNTNKLQNGDGNNSGGKRQETNQTEVKQNVEEQNRQITEINLGNTHGSGKYAPKIPYTRRCKTSKEP
uniref:Uncharacterized protein n=1 Tax=Trichobilharzia regenti TaxID=157069 RepID=A0AA85ITK8_TRIRE|nr:unnamed protein product [Trichobilharzia regenti]